MEQRGGAHLAFTRCQTRESGPENWRSAAACRFVDPELFFPVSATGKSLEQATEAKRICWRDRGRSPLHICLKEYEYP